jgi:hypothetical protein
MSEPLMLKLVEVPREKPHPQNEEIKGKNEPAMEFEKKIF